jgi:hypothetical protein
MNEDGKLDPNMVNHILARMLEDAGRLGRELAAANVNERHAMLTIATQYVSLGINTAMMVGGPNLATEVLLLHLEQLRHEIN